VDAPHVVQTSLAAVLMGICAFVCESAMGTAEIAHELTKVRRARSRPLNHHGSGDPDSAADHIHYIPTKAIQWQRGHKKCWRPHRNVTAKFSHEDLSQYLERRLLS